MLLVAPAWLGGAGASAVIERSSMSVSDAAGLCWVDVDVEMLMLALKYSLCMVVARWDTAHAGQATDVSTSIPAVLRQMRAALATSTRSLLADTPPKARVCC